MTRSRKNVAVLLAGGVGSHAVGLDLPKQLIKIAGKPIIEHTLAASEHPAGRRDHRDDGPRLPRCQQRIVRGGGYTKVSQILEGAGTRNDTSGRRCRARATRTATC